MANRRNSNTQTKRRTAMRNDETYIYGNTVRKAQVVPKRTDREEVGKPQSKKKEVSAQVRKNRKHALHMNTAYTLFLTVAAIATLSVCVWYLQLRFEMTSHTANLASMEQELADLKEENTTRENSILDSVNLEDVKDYAINSLGMVYADSSQIITYQNSAGDTVKQYQKIPKKGALD